MAVDVDLLVGAIVGRCYRIIEKLSTGGMGTIYAGEHEELGKRVAIKVLHPHVCEKPSAIERFLREARTASQIGHPNVVDVFDLGRCDDGRPFMVMPLLEGMDCERALAERGPQHAGRVADWLEGAAAGLDALHRRGLVHRDIKPANVFLQKLDDGSEISMIMDFGLAAFQRQGSKLTAEGIVLGTPHYLPPECATGTKTDVPGDVYSLAVVAFELLTGVLPFDHTDPAYVMAAKISNTAPRLSSRINGVPAELDELFRRALSRQPAKRPPSCTELIEALRATAPDAPVEANVPKLQRNIETAQLRTRTNHPTRDSVQIPVRRRGLALTVVLLALLVGGGVWLAVPDRQPPGSVERAQSAHVAQSDDRVARLPDALDVEEPTPAPLAEPRLRMRSRVRLGKREPTGPAIEGIERIERIEAAEEADVSSMEAVPTVPQQDHVRAARLTREANQLSLRGLLPAAIAKYREATLASPAHADAWRGLGIANQRMNRIAEARRAFERYLRVAPDAADATRIQQRLASL